MAFVNIVEHWDYSSEEKCAQDINTFACHMQQNLQMNSADLEHVG